MTDKAYGFWRKQNAFVAAQTRLSAVSRVSALLLVLCLLCSLVPQSAAAATQLADIVDVNAYPSQIDETLSCDKAFSKANQYYIKGSYKKAHSYYLLALKKIASSKTYTEGDVCNNLVLTLLQRKKNKTAYKLCRYMLEQNLAKTPQDRYGYMLNLLVCAHANGVPAAKELRLAMAKGYFSFKDLASLYEQDPGSYAKLLSGLIYNTVYIDMEGDAYDGAASAYYYPMGSLSSLAKKSTLQKLAELTKGKEKPASKSARKKVTGGISARDYLIWLKDVLNVANRWNRTTFNQTDPDIEELLKYVDALMAQRI